jgi:hypothetical protein
MEQWKSVLSPTSRGYPHIGLIAESVYTAAEMNVTPTVAYLNEIDLGAEVPS